MLRAKIAGSAAAVALAAGGFVGASSVLEGGGATADAAAGARNGSVAIALPSMELRPSSVCAPPTCEIDPGVVTSGTTQNWVVGARGSFFASVTLPSGARITSLDLVGFSAAAGPGAGPTAALYRIHADNGRSLLLANVSARGGTTIDTARTARRKLSPVRTADQRNAYLVEVRFAPRSERRDPQGAALVRVNYTAR